MDLTSLTIDDARRAVQEQKVSATALAESYYAKIEQDDAQIGAYLTLSKDRAMAQTSRIVAARSHGVDPGRLRHGAIFRQSQIRTDLSIVLFNLCVVGLGERSSGDFLLLYCSPRVVDGERSQVHALLLDHLRHFEEGSVGIGRIRQGDFLRKGLAEALEFVFTTGISETFTSA